MVVEQSLIETTVGVVDVGIANLGSICRSLHEIASKVVIVRTPDQLENIDRLVLPGVGAFPVAMQRLRASGLDSGVHVFAHHFQKPLLGICLGMQLLADIGEEHGRTAGLGLIAGRVRRLKVGPRQRVPHVGWNSVSAVGDSLLLKGVPLQTDFYFVHSFVFDVVDPTSSIGVCDYGENFAAIVRRANIHGVQFHPEKSSFAGRRVLKNFCEYC